MQVVLPRYFAHIAYDGSPYRGWQRQPNAFSIQEQLETSMATVLKQQVHCAGCGRTDALVHASQYFFHFDTTVPLKEDFVFVINKVLPDSISVFETIEVHSGAHAQFDALERTYHYFAHTHPHPFLSHYSTFYPNELLHIAAMREAAMQIPKVKDFVAFCKSPEKHNHTQCDVTAALVEVSGTGIVRFSISANRFLRGMIRALMHDLLLVGSGKMDQSTFQMRLGRSISVPNIQLAYPQGLHLAGVKYDYLTLPPKMHPLGSIPFQ